MGPCHQPSEPTHQLCTRTDTNSGGGWRQKPPTYRTTQVVAILEDVCRKLVESFKSGTSSARDQTEEGWTLIHVSTTTATFPLGNLISPRSRPNGNQADEISQGIHLPDAPTNDCGSRGCTKHFGDTSEYPHHSWSPN
jgi:hypothetical protein